MTDIDYSELEDHDDEEEAEDASGDIDPTPDELKAIRNLKRLAKRWPDSLWLYSGGGNLCVMRAGEGGEHIMNGEAVDPNYILAEIRIPNSGGDW